MNVENYLFRGLTRKMVYKSLDAGSLRARAIANNMANVSTPGFQRNEVEFESQLRRAFKIKVRGKVTHNKHMEIDQKRELSKVHPRSYKPEDPTLPGEINNVDVDAEMAKLAENQILYNYAVKFAGFGKFNAAITGRPTE